MEKIALAPIQPQKSGCQKSKKEEKVESPKVNNPRILLNFNKHMFWLKAEIPACRQAGADLPTEALAKVGALAKAGVSTIALAKAD